MRRQARHACLVPTLAHIPAADHAVPAATAEDGAGPCERAHAVCMAHQLPDLLCAASVPDLDLGVGMGMRWWKGEREVLTATSFPAHDLHSLTPASACVSPHRKVSTVCTPGHAADIVASIGHGAQLLHTASRGIPQ
eukprot:scaffold75673_cov16-Tisochrysis_lutea.AAC.1